MAEAVQIGNATLYCGDCLDVLKTLPDASIEAIVTDPPYGLAFMGKHWDYDVPAVEVWQECLRVLKPGGHLLAFAGTRTFHRMAVRIEDAGFEIRDMIAWVYGSGFPKSLDVSKALDKLAGAEREVIGRYQPPNGSVWNLKNDNRGGGLGAPTGLKSENMAITAPATDAAQQWSGWGTALKPALEPIALCRKPLDGTVAQNVLTHGTGAINVDGCRVEGADAPAGRTRHAGGVPGAGTSYELPDSRGEMPEGRFPANLIHDGSDEVVALFPQTTSGFLPAGTIRNCENHVYGLGMASAGKPACLRDFGGDTGSAARFFYCAKASKADRDEGCGGLPQHDTSLKYNGGDGFAGRTQVDGEWVNTDKANRVKPRNHHPTVKPTALMTYLCRLITPPGGTVLDPFMGSGSTGKAAMLEGFRFIGIEREAEYLAIAQARISAAQRQPDLFHQEAA